MQEPFRVAGNSVEPKWPGASNQVVYEYVEDLLGPALPSAVEAFLTQEPAWHRFVRGTGEVTAVE